VAFYKHLGFEVVGESVSMEMCFRDVDAMPVYDARTGVLDLQHFAVFQEAFALPDSAFFPANGVTLLGAWDEGDDGAPLPLGFARFDVKFPGAFPFRVVRPAVATVLLREIERHATHAPNKGNVPDITQEFTLPTTRLVVDDDAATAGLLRVFGAIVHTDLVRLRREAHAPLSSTEFAAP
jgi:hypothetical protein